MNTLISNLATAVPEVCPVVEPKPVWVTRLLRALACMVSFPAMLGALLVLRALFLVRTFFVDPDLWWHLKSGDAILSTYSFPTVDPYSFTCAGQPWIACEWIGDVLFAFVYRIGGVMGLEALSIILSAAVLIALYVFATVKSGNSKAAFLVAAVYGQLASASLNLRPQSIGYVLLFVFLIALERFKQGHRKMIWLLPPLLWIWINTHGSWIAGFGAIVLYLCGGLLEFRLGALQSRRWTDGQRIRLELVLLGCVAIMPLGPYGTRLAALPFELTHAYPLSLANIREWFPMPFDIPGGKLFLGVVLLFFVLQVIANFNWRAEDLALFLGGLMMACLHVRFLILFVPFSAGVLALMLARWTPAYDRRKDIFAINAVLIAAVIASFVYFFPARARVEQDLAKEFPARALDYMQSHPVSGPVFNNYGFGGYMVWRLAPRQKVFIDGRADLYEPGGVFADYLTATNIKPGAMQVLKLYNIHACLLERNEPLAVVLASMPDWERVYMDSTSVLLVRRKGLDARAGTSVTIPHS